MSDMSFSAICKTEEEARKLAKLSRQRFGNPYGWNAGRIKSTKNPSSGNIEWWKDDAPPVIPLDWTGWYWQGERELADFFAAIKTAELARRNLYQANFEKFQQAFPVLEWEIKDRPYWFVARVVTRYGGGSSAAPVWLDNERFVEMYVRLAQMAATKEAKETLTKAYPSLWFDAGAGALSSHATPAMQAFVGGGNPTAWAVYTRYYDDYVKMWRCGTSVNYQFTLPLTHEIRDRLTQLNAEAEKSNRDGWFFCTTCQKAYPRDAYGLFYFAESRCKSCVESDPKWERIARSETYN